MEVLRSYLVYFMKSDLKCEESVITNGPGEAEIRSQPGVFRQILQVVKDAIASGLAAMEVKSINCVFKYTTSRRRERDGQRNREKLVEQSLYPVCVFHRL